MKPKTLFMSSGWEYCDDATIWHGQSRLAWTWRWNSEISHVELIYLFSDHSPTRDLVATRHYAKWIANQVVEL